MMIAPQRMVQIPASRVAGFSLPRQNTASPKFAGLEDVIRDGKREFKESSTLGKIGIIALGLWMTTLTSVAGAMGYDAWRDIRNQRETVSLSTAYGNGFGVGNRKDYIDKARKDSGNAHTRAWAYQQVKELPLTDSQKVAWYLQGLQDDNIDVYGSVLKEAKAFAPSIKEQLGLHSMFQAVLELAPPIQKDLNFSLREELQIIPPVYTHAPFSAEYEKAAADLMRMVAPALEAKPKP